MTAEPPAAAESPGSAEGEDDRGPVDRTHTILMYLPNRLLDLVDVFRLRARLGPGTALGIRATDYADVYLGSYTSIFAGLPGPRMGRTIPIPVGFENLSGAEISKAEALVTGPFGPDYSPSEFGVNLHLILIGADLGIDPVEIADFFAGIANRDIRKDDL